MNWLKDLKVIDLIKYTINLYPRAQPVYKQKKKYIIKKRKFANKIFPKIKETGISIKKSNI